VQAREVEEHAAASSTLPAMEARAMSTQGDETRRPRDLHEDYAWRVNAAIGEGREDLVRKLADKYLIKAMHAMSDERLHACRRSYCAVCTQPLALPARRPSRRGRLWRLMIGARAASAFTPCFHAEATTGLTT
jgi:hypothetical protein